MKRTLLLLVLLVSMSISFAGQWTSINSQQPSPARTDLVSSDITTSVIHFKVDGFFLNEVKTPRGTEYTVSLGKSSQLLDKGSPDLPKLTASVIIPDNALMRAEVISASFTDFPDISIAPSKGNLHRDIDPATVPYEYGRPYLQNEFYPASRAELRSPYILRDYRGQTLVVNPFLYNPITRVLRVYHDLTVRVFQSGTSQFNALNRVSTPASIDPDFKQVYENQFINRANQDNPPLNDYGRMLIICYGQYLQAMQPFVDWKNAMGIRTEIVDVSTIGSDESAIKDYVSNYYSTNGLTFLLLIGDGPQIPTNTSGDLGGPSDNAYGYIVGNDHYPDVFVGRFSAESVDHVNTMVQRTLEYERSPLATSDWAPLGIGIGSDQGPGDDNEDDYEHIRNIRTRLMGFTYSAVSELYDGSQGGEDISGNPSSSLVSEKVNAGSSIINYCGHGSQTSWGTTGFSNSNVNQLSNNHKWPFILSVACVNGDFVNGTCFAEAWLRAKNNNGPTGAVATVMSTINQSWDPPMCAQDEMNDLLVGTYPNNIKRTFGGLTMNGCYKMNDEYGSGGDEMTDTWAIFGDPSVQVRTAVPGNMVVSHEAQLFMGSTSFSVNVNTEGALVGLSMNNQYFASAFVTNGSATISFPAMQMPDTIHIVATAFNKLPYQADVAIIPNNGPYLIYYNNQIHDTAFNNNGRADYGETVTLDLGLNNIGVLAASNVQVSLTSTDPYITLVDSTEIYTEIPAADTVAVPNGFSFILANNIPDLHKINFLYTATNGLDTWNGVFSVTGHSAVIKYISTLVSDPQGNNNGKADPGETFDLVININNAGTSDATNAVGQISFNDPWVTLLSSSIQEIGYLPKGTIKQCTFTLKAEQETPIGHVVPCALLLTADLGLVTEASFSFVIGQIPVAVIDLDGNQNSGPSIRNALNANNVFAEYKTSLPGELIGYQTLFVCLGTNTSKHVLSNAEGQLLSDFLTNGGRLYMEGGDTWYYDPKTPLHPFFKAVGITDGGNDLSVEIGQPGSFGDSISFAFAGDNEFIDRLAANPPAFSIFKNESPGYISAIAYDAGSYRTIASAFEFGGLTNGEAPSTRNEYMRRIIEFFGVLTTPITANFIGIPVNICEGGTVVFNNFSTGGATQWAWAFPGGVPATSSESSPSITYPEPGLYDVTLIAGNGQNSSTLTRQSYVWVEYCTGIRETSSHDINIFPNPASGYALISFGDLKGLADIRLANAEGNVIYSANKVSLSKSFSLNLADTPSGVYFVTIITSSENIVKKLIVGR